MPVTLTLPYWPGKTFPGSISFLNPFLDPQTRTLKARLEVPNPELLLKPEMYGEMTLSYDLGEKLAVPESALMRTGQRTFVFLQTGAGDWTPRRSDGRRPQRRLLRSPVRAEGGRPGRDLGQLPRGLRVLPQGRPPGRARGNSHDPQESSSFSANNRLLVILVVAAAVAVLRLHDDEHPPGRHPGPDRHPGHRLHALGPQPGHHGGPGHLPHHHRAAGRAEGEGHPGLLRFRLLLRLRHLPGRHGHLLGPQPGHGVPLQDPGQPARRASRRNWAPTPPASAGSSSTPWWTRAASTTWPSCAPIRTGTCATPSRACPAWPRWPASAASRSSTR